MNTQELKNLIAIVNRSLKYNNSPITLELESSYNATCYSVNYRKHNTKKDCIAGTLRQGMNGKDCELYLSGMLDALVNS